MKALLEKIRKILRSRRTRQLLTRAVSGVAAIVVFITTYALVLPAITMEQDAFCGIPEHQHTDACYEERLVCEIPESEEHHHDASCYEKFLICGKEVHTHSTECYQKDSSAVVSSGSGAAASTALEAFAEPDAYETGVSEFASGAAVMDSAAGGQSVMEEPADKEAASAQDAAEGNEEVAEGTEEVDLVSEGLASEAEDLNAAGTDEGEDAPEKPSENNAPETVPDGSDNVDNGLENTEDIEDTEQEGPAVAGDSDLTAESGQDLAGTDLETSGSSNSENIDADTTNSEDTENKDSEEDKTAVDIFEDADSELTGKVNKEDQDPGLEAGDSHGMNEDSVSGSDTLDNLDTLDTSDLAAEDTDGAETEDTAAAAGTEEAANDATTNVLPEPAKTEKLSSGYVPELDSIEFGTVLNKHTDFFFFHPEEGQELPASSAEVTDWKKVKNGFFGSTKLESTDLVKMYLSYTIPAGTLNETNQVVRYRLPSNIHLTDDQIIAINATENGMSALYADAVAKEDESRVDQGDENISEDAGDEARAEELESDDKAEESVEDAGTASGTDELDGADIEAASDTSEQVQDENTANYQKYLGAEAIKGTRTPDETLKEGAQEYISAIVKAENVFDDEGLYGEKGAFLGQDLIFIFTPYSIEKNQTTYNADGDPVSAGEKITGWFACDFNMSQIDWVEEDTDLDNSTVEKTAEVIFVEKDSEKNVKEISRKLKLVDVTGDQSDVANGGETAVVAETAAAAETAAVAETAAAAETATVDETASETASTDETALASTGNTSDQAVPEDAENEPFKSGTLTADGDGYRITLDYTEEAKIPENAELSVREITAETDGEAYEACLEQAGQQMAVDDKTSVDQKASRFFDIEILVKDLVKDTDSDGKTEVRKIEPSAPVSVNIQIIDSSASESAASGDKQTNQSDPAILHFAEEGVEQIDSTVKTSEEQDNNNARSGSEEPEPATEISFEAESFSIYGVVYTVDFEYSVNGQMYDFSLPGGGFVSFTDLVEVLGIIDDTNTEQNGDETGSVIAENNEENAANEGAEENSVNSDTNTSLTLGGVEVSEATRNFVADVTSVEFSNSELVDVSRVEADTTVGQIKDSRGLECEYSAELTEEQIAEINAQTVEAGDWALISVQPFTGEETLTVTMKNGDQFLVKVTDAQISTHVITTKGEHFRITVTYDEDAKIPDGSKLVAREILEGTEEYEQYLEDAAIEWEEAEREGFISYARFFDLEIQKDGKKIEPEAPVEVEIDHEEGFTLGIDESLSVIHFAQKGTEIIDELHRNEDGTEVIYEQNGFSVIGTVSTVKDSGWPTANGQYVLVLQDGDDYYALKQDGTLTKIRYFNNTVSFIGEGTTTTDYIDDYLWYVQSYSGANARGRISDKYYESGSVEDQMFIVPTQNGWLANSATQIRFNSTERKLYYTYYNVSRTLSAHNGQLNVVNLDDPSGSPIFFASVSSFTANDNETDLFTQEEVESIISKWREQKTQESTYDKTAEVYDYENRVYQVDITASSADYEVAPSIALEFVVDASRSMFFPTSVNQVGTFNGTNASNVRDWINANGNTDQIYFVIQNKNGAATQYAIFYDPNSEYEVNHGWWTETKYGQWLWCDASVYNPPDDVSNGGDNNSMQSGLPLSEWNWDNMDDGKIYTTDITGTSDGTYGTRKTWVSRIEYLKQCARVASQVIYAVDENAQIGLIGFNASVTDYGTFGKSDQQALLNNIDNISLAGGTNHQAGLQTAIDKYQDQDFYAQHYAGRKHVVVLVTDGAPNQSGVNWTTIGTVATNLKNLEDDFGHKTELYTMGLSLTNVGSNQSNLFNISSGTGYTYAGEDAAQIINAVTKIVDGIFVQANLVADVTDVIDPAFYPVNKADGRPLAEDDWINLNGTKVSSGANDAAGQIKKDPSTGNWYVEWKDQSIDWPTTDSNGAVTEPGWHGTVFVKAKEDFLGGNGISTNAEGSQLEATKYIVRGETEQHDLPQGDHTTSFETPYVNVDELDITNNDTEWTVYLGTNVDPLTEVKALWEKVKIKEVVTKTDSDHRMSSDGSLTYQYAANTNDNRDETNGREEFSISDLEITLTEDDWTDLIAGNSKTFTYSAYNHSSVGTIMISLTQAVAEGEKNLTESPHDTTVTGDEVEKYTLTVSYRPKGANITNWHTGSYGSGMAGIRAGNISKDNTHIINVYVKGLQITKVDLNDQVLPGAKFALYRSARTGETDLLEIDGEQYFKVAELDTSSTGIAVKEQIEQLEEGEQYYLVETEVPAGYIVISPIPVNLNISDIYTPKPGTTTQTTKPDSGIYDWTQNASLVLNAESGVKRTNADNTADLTHSAVTANSDMETIYYRITNNPGVELPSTGGPGTRIFTLLGSILILGAGVLLWRRRRLI